MKSRNSKQNKQTAVQSAPDDLTCSMYTDISLISQAKHEISAILDQVELEQISKNVHFFISNPFPLDTVSSGRQCMTIDLHDTQIFHMSKLITNVFEHFEIDDIENKLKRTNVIVRRYKPGMSIPFHIDDNKCESTVIGIILQNDNPDHKGLQFMQQNKVYTMQEEEGSIFCMEGIARYGWKHGLPPVSHERISVTCRIFKEDIYRSVKNKATTENAENTENMESKERAENKADTIAQIENINVSIVLNTDRNKCKIVVISPFFNMNNMKQLSKNKFNKIKAVKFYRINGSELQDNDVIKNKEKIFISKGENFIGSTIDREQIQIEQNMQEEELIKIKYENVPIMSIENIRKHALKWSNTVYATITFNLIQQLTDGSIDLPVDWSECVNDVEVGNFLRDSADLTIPEFRELIFAIADTVNTNAELQWYTSTKLENDTRYTSIYIVQEISQKYYWIGFEATAKKAVKGKFKRDGPLWALDGGINNPGAKRKGNAYQLKRGIVTTDHAFMFAGTTWPSTYYTCEIIIDGLKYTSAAQYVMASQANFFSDNERYIELMNGSYDPSPHKLFDHKSPKTGIRSVKNFNKEQWDEIGPNIMYRATYEKFNQNPKLKSLLLETGNKTIIEGTDDPVWGIGMALNHSDALNPKKWLGENKMGELLENIRSKFAI